MYVCTIHDAFMYVPAFWRTSTVSKILPPVVITSSIIKQDSPASNIPVLQDQLYREFCSFNSNFVA